MIDVLGLRVLIALDDTGSVTAAAQNLGYTASNITQHLRRIERALGSSMVERVGRGIVLTERARTLVERGRPLLLQLDDLGATTVPEPRGNLGIAAFPTALRGLVVPAMASMQAAHPDLRVHPHELDPRRAIEAVRLGRVHAAVVKQWGNSGLPGGGSGASASLQDVMLGEDRIDAVLHRAHPLASQNTLSLKQLGAENWAVTPGDDPYRVWLTEHRQTIRLDPPATYEATEFASLLSYVQHRLAVAAIPRLGRDYLPDETVAIPLTDATAVRRVSVVVRASSRGGPVLETLLSQLTATANEVFKHAQ